MATRLKAPAAVDAAQLRSELAEFAGVAVTDPDAEGRVYVEVPEDVNAERVAFRLGRHFPRALVAAILAVDFEGATNLADLRARCVELRNRTARALRARWE